MERKSKAFFVARLSIFAALSLAISAMENAIPPLPFMPLATRVGFSNIIVMFSATACGLPTALFIAAFKAVFALITRGALAAAMSLVGGVLSCLAVWLLGKLRPIGYIGLGVAGAAAHNFGQIAVAAFAVGGAIRFYAPIMLITGIMTGALTGLLLKLTEPIMIKLLKGGKSANANYKNSLTD